MARYKKPGRIIPAVIVLVLLAAGCGVGQKPPDALPAAAESAAAPESPPADPVPSAGTGASDDTVVSATAPVNPQGSPLAALSPPAEPSDTPGNVPPSASALPAVDPDKAAESEKFYAEGMAYYNQYEFSQAVMYFDKALEANPWNYKVYADKGVALCYLGNCQKGIEQIEKALELKPDFYPAFYSMAMAYKVLGDYDQCLVWFEQNLEHCPDNAWSNYGIATIYADRGDADKALEYLKKAVELDPGIKSTAAGQDHFAKMRSMPEFQALVK